MVEKTQLAPGSYAYKDDAGRWRAGERSNKYTSGEFVPESYAKQVRGSVVFRNKTAGLLKTIEQTDPEKRTERQQEVLDGGYNEAQKAMSEFTTLQKDLKKAERQEDSERIEQLEQELSEKREQMGSP